MENLKSLTIIFLLAIGLLAPASLAKPASVLPNGVGKKPNLPDYAKPIPPAKLREDLNFLFKTIEEVHPNMYAYTSKEEFGRYCDQLYSQIEQPMTRLEFYNLVAPVVASLRNGHSWILPPFGELNEYASRGGKIFPLKCEWDGEKLIITKNRGPVDVPIGGTLLRINDKPVQQVVSRIARLRPTETRQSDPRWAARFLHYGLWLYGETADLYKLQIGMLDGTVKEYSVKAVTADQIKAWKKKSSPKTEKYSYRYIRQANAGLIEFNSCTDLPKFKEFLKDTFGMIRKHKMANLIIDIRKNPGGSTLLGDALLDYLTDKPFRQFEKVQMKVSSPQVLEWVQQHMLDTKAELGTTVTGGIALTQPMDNPLRFRGRTFLLIGPGCFSSSVSLASAMRCFGIATLIGEETGDATASYGETYTFKLPNTSLVGEVAQNYYVQAGGKPDGHGVLPDYEVRQKPKDTAKGVDTVLQFTLNLIKENK